MISKEVRQDVIESINGVRKDLEIIRQNLNEMQNMLYRCSTVDEYENWLNEHCPENGTNHIEIFG